MRRSLPAALLAVLSPFAQAADPPGMVAGWDPGNGHVLLEAANCTACHAAGDDATQIASKRPPILKEVGTRVTPQWLRSYLADPLAAKPGTTMPDVLHGLPEGRRAETVEALTHYLVSLGGPIDQRASGSSLAQIERGRELYHMVGCVACHQPFDEPPKHESTLPKGIDPEDLAELGLPGTAPPKPSVPLGPLAMKTTVDALATFLENPLHTRPSGWMPRMSLKAGEARFIAAYLLRDQYDEDESSTGVGLDLALYEGAHNNIPDFETLTPVVETEARGFAANQVKLPNGQVPKSNFALRFHGVIDVPEDGEYRFWTKSDDASTLHIDGKLVVDNNGVHAPAEKTGTIQLRKGRHEFDLGFAQVGGGYELTVHWQPPGGKRGDIPPGILLHSTAAMIPKGIVDFAVDPNLVAKGKQAFVSYGCANCHDTGEEFDKLAAEPLAAMKLDNATGCLGERIAPGRPRYSANAEQRKAIATAIAAIVGDDNAAPEPDEYVTHAMTRFNCLACHQRDKKGGPDIERADFFQYEVLVDFGDEGRMPPAINEVGAKLTEEGFADMLLRGVRNRTYMATRMPLFGPENVGHLPGWFARADAGKIPEHDYAFDKRLVDDGRTLAGKKGLVCINCHAWGGNRLPGAEGLDLQSVSRRIQPDWFHALLKDPQALRPGTRMPLPWPNGKTPFADIQGGDVDRQIDALWAYLAAGPRGGLPFGLSPEDSTRLVPNDEPITFRTFFDQVSAHTILVGYRQRVNVGFDANRVKMAIAWSGDFVSTRETWDGRAGQYTKVPAGSAVVRMPDGPAFAVLESGGTDPWPEDVPKSAGSIRTPPGHAFRGYRYDADRIPTFLYDVHGVKVRETPTTDFDERGSLMRRTIELTAREPVENLHLRIATGDIEAADSAFRSGEVTYTISGANALVRTIDGEDELVVPVRFEKTPDGWAAKVVVDTIW